MLEFHTHMIWECYIYNYYCWQNRQQYCWFKNIPGNIVSYIADYSVTLLAILSAILSLVLHPPWCNGGRNKRYTSRYKTDDFNKRFLGSWKKLHYLIKSILLEQKKETNLYLKKNRVLSFFCILYLYIKKISKLREV